MISNKLFPLKNALTVLCNPINYSFGTYMTRKVRQQLKAPYKVPDYHKDDLMLPKTDRDTEGEVQRIVDYVKRAEDPDLKPVNIGQLLYNASKFDIAEPTIVEGIERNLPKYVGHFQPRWVFGALYGMYRLNVGSLQGIEFFETELLSKIGEIKRHEAAELIEGLSYSKQLSKTHKFNFIKQNLQPIIVGQWKNFQYQVKYLMVLLRAIVRLEYYDQELCDLLLTALTGRRSIKKFELVLEIYVTLKTLNESGKFYRDLTTEMDHFKSIMQNNVDLTWRFDIDQLRFKTYDELKAVREDFKYWDQYLEETDPQLSAEDEQKRLELEQEEKEEEDRAARDAHLNEIVRDRYMSIVRGDIGELEGLENRVVLDNDESEHLKKVEDRDRVEEEEEEEIRKAKKKKFAKGKGKGKKDESERDFDVENDDE